MTCHLLGVLRPCPERDLTVVPASLFIGTISRRFILLIHPLAAMSRSLVFFEPEERRAQPWPSAQRYILILVGISLRLIGYFTAS